VSTNGGSKTQLNEILGNRERLREQFNTRILRPVKAAAFIRMKVIERDGFNAQVAALAGAASLESTGED
jgi:hypothetical protein